MKVFISYSSDDSTLVKRIADDLKPHADVFYWDDSKELGKDTWDQIFAWIDYADLVLVVITGNALKRAFAVGQETGRSRAKGIHTIPLVTMEVPNSELGCLSHLTYQKIDKGNPEPAIDEIKKTIFKMKQKEEQMKSIAAFALCCLVVWAIASGE